MNIAFASRQEHDIGILAIFGADKIQPLQRRKITVAADEQAFSRNPASCLSLAPEHLPGDLPEVRNQCQLLGSKPSSASRRSFSIERLPELERMMTRLPACLRRTSVSAAPG